MVDWPRLFVAVPRLGDGVQGNRTGPGPGTHPVLYVCAITHRVHERGFCFSCGEAYGRWENGVCPHCGDTQAYVEIELHRANSVPKR